MALPDILFNNASGSDTAASGAGPGTALSGSASAHTNNAPSTTIQLPATDLSGVVDTGAHVLWLKTATTTRRFSKITAVDDVNNTVTVEDSFTIDDAAPVDWAIGGKRKTIEHADSVRLFIADAKPGWTITLEDDQPALTATIVCTAAGDLTTGYITLRGDSTTTRRLLTSATNNISMLSGGLVYWKIKNLAFTSTATTKTTSYGIIFNATAVGRVIIDNCIFGDATNTLQRAWYRSATAQLGLVAKNCEVKNCISYGCGSSGGSSGGMGSGGVTLINCFIHDNGGGGVDLHFIPDEGTHLIKDCIITDNTGYGIFVFESDDNVGKVHITDCTIHNNSSDGINIAGEYNASGLVITNNQITKNGAYGVNFGNSAALNDSLVALVDHNNTGTGALANTSGAYNNLTAGANDQQLDPSYTNAAGDDYSIGDTACKAGGYPSAPGHIGINSATHTYKDIGAAQRQETTPDFPDVGNVTEDDTVNGSQGTYHEATEAEVQQGVTFGASSALTGTYVGSGGRPELRGGNL